MWVTKAEFPLHVRFSTHDLLQRPWTTRGHPLLWPVLLLPPREQDLLTPSFLHLILSPSRITRGTPLPSRARASLCGFAPHRALASEHEDCCRPFYWLTGGWTGWAECGLKGWQWGQGTARWPVGSGPQERTESNGAETGEGIYCQESTKRDSQTLAGSEPSGNLVRNSKAWLCPTSTSLDIGVL